MLLEFYFIFISIYLLNRLVHFILVYSCMQITHFNHSSNYFSSSFLSLLHLLLFCHTLSYFHVCLLQCSHIAEHL